MMSSKNIWGQEKKCWQHTKYLHSSDLGLLEPNYILNSYYLYRCSNGKTSPKTKFNLTVFLFWKGVRRIIKYKAIEACAV